MKREDFRCRILITQQYHIDVPYCENYDKERGVNNSGQWNTGCPTPLLGDYLKMGFNDISADNVRTDNESQFDGAPHLTNNWECGPILTENSMCIKFMKLYITTILKRYEHFFQKDMLKRLMSFTIYSNMELWTKSYWSLWKEGNSIHFMLVYEKK